MSPAIPNGIITQYEVRYRKSDDTLYNVSNITSEMMGNLLTGRVEGLLPFIVYVIQLRAYTQVGKGPYSDSLTLPECKKY